MKSYYNQIFCKDFKNISIIIEDNGLVCYAYLLIGEQIVSDVWLYNSGFQNANIKFKNENNSTLYNPIEYTENKFSITNVKFLDDVVPDITITNEEVSAILNFKNGLQIKLKSDFFPGWSNNVRKDSPYALLLNN